MSHKEHTEADGILFPSYLPTAELIAALASLWFGKRFDVQGPLQEHGSFRLPTPWANRPITYPAGGPFSHEPRKDLDIKLSWNTFDRPFEFFPQYLKGDSRISAFWRATRFYAQALRSFENDPEVAFFHFITAIEILAQQMQFTDDQKFDSDILQILTQIREGLPKGESVEKEIRSRLYQLKRKVSLCAVELTNDNFFKGSEADHPAGRLLKEELLGRMKFSYDLRSKYVHEGADIGGGVHNSPAFTQEIQMGRPVMEDKKLSRLLQKALTLAGLERLVRFMTLRFAHLKISPLHEALK
jgi:hypothetical protein